MHGPTFQDHVAGEEKHEHRSQHGAGDVTDVAEQKKASTAKDCPEDDGEKHVPSSKRQDCQKELWPSDELMHCEALGNNEEERQQQRNGNDYNKESLHVL